MNLVTQRTSKERNGVPKMLEKKIYEIYTQHKLMTEIQNAQEGNP